MIARRSLLVVANSALGALLGFVALFFMARYMGDALVGARAYVLSIVFLLGLVTRLGLPTTHARRLARGDHIASSNGTYLAIKMGLTVLFLLLAGGGLLLWIRFLGTPTDITEQALRLGIAIVAIKSLRDFTTNTFRGLEQIMAREATLLTNTIVTVLFTITSAMAYAHGTGRWTPLPALSQAIADAYGVTGPVGFAQALAWLMAAYLAGEVAAFLLGWLTFLRQRIPVGAPHISVAKQYATATLPIMIVTLSGLILRRIDQVMIGFWHRAADVGHYAGATKLTELVLILANGIRVALLPLISRLDKAGDVDELADIVQQAERWISLLVWPLVVFGALAAEPILRVLLSNAFLPAAPMFILLLGHSLIASLTVPLRTKALGLGKHGYAAKVAVGAVLINIVLNVLLIPKYAGTGAAVATIAAGVWMLAAYRHRAQDWTGHPILPPHLWKHALAALAAGAIAWWLPLPELVRFYDLMWFGLLVLGFYVAFIALLGELRRDDWDAAKRIWRSS